MMHVSSTYQNQLILKACYFQRELPRKLTSSGYSLVGFLFVCYCKIYKMLSERVTPALDGNFNGFC